MAYVLCPCLSSSSSLLPLINFVFNFMFTILALFCFSFVFSPYLFMENVLSPHIIKEIFGLNKRCNYGLSCPSPYFISRSCTFNFQSNIVNLIYSNIYWQFDVNGFSSLQLTPPCLSGDIACD